MPIFAVLYTYTEATVAARDQHRPAHREWLRGLLDAGTLLSTGPYPDGSGALILIRQPDLAAAETLFAADPFARADAVDGVRIVEWSPVMGAFAG